MADGSRHILTHSEIDQLRAFMYGLLMGRPDLQVGDGMQNPMLLLDSHEELGSIIADLVMLEEQADLTRHPACTHGAQDPTCPNTPPALHRARAALASMNQPGRII